MSEPIDLDDARADIENSMHADDRQTRGELRRGQQALDAVITELEGYRARAAEESAANAERSKRAAELIAKMRRVANSAVFGIPSEALAGIHADLDELRELLGLPSPPETK